MSYCMAGERVLRIPCSVAASSNPLPAFLLASPALEKPVLSADIQKAYRYGWVRCGAEAGTVGATGMVLGAVIVGLMLQPHPIFTSAPWPPNFDVAVTAWTPLLRIFARATVAQRRL